MENDVHEVTDPAPRCIWLTSFCVFVTVCAAAPPTLGFMGRWWWRFELLSHFRVQYFFGLLALTAGLLVLRRWKTAAASGAFMLLNVILIAPLFLGATGTEDPSSAYVLLFANVRTANRQHDRLLELVEKTQPDVIVLAEVSDRWMASLESLPEDYKIAAAAPRWDNFGIAVLSRVPGTRAEVKYFGPSGFPSVVAQVGGGPDAFGLVGTHPAPPMREIARAERDEQMREIAEYVATMRGPKLVAGDFNMTSWAPAFGDFIAATGLRDSRRGFGVRPTWPSANPILRIPIDHCVVSEEIAVHDHRVGPDIGSDHRPIIVKFSVR